MNQELQHKLTKAQQGKLYQLQLEVEALWSQIQNKSSLQFNCHIQAIGKERSIISHN